jgi:ubiquinone biosynthesis protein COQ9
VATELYMLQDNSSDDHQATWEFLDRRIENVLELGKILNKNANFASAV